MRDIYKGRSRVVLIFLLCAVLAFFYHHHYQRQLGVGGGKMSRQEQLGVTPLLDPVDQRGYIITLDYSGQMVAGLRAIHSLQCWISSFQLPMVLVEPYVVQSRLIHGADLWKRESEASTPARTPLTLSDFFDMEYLVRDSKSLFVGTEDLWSKAPRTVIVVTLAGSTNSITNCLLYTKKTMCWEKRASHMLRAKSLATSGCESQEDLKIKKKATNYLVQRGFTVARSVCINCERNFSKYFTPSELVELIFGDYKPSEVTLVINHWKFLYEVSPQCVTCKQQIAPGDNTLSLMQFAPSPKLVQLADNYITRLKGNDPTAKVIAVMIRVEWFLINHKESTELLEVVKDCLSNVFHSFTQMSITNSRTVLALDIGKYGSGTFDQTIKKNGFPASVFSQIVESVKEFVTQVHVNYDKWEESFESDDRGYVALLQSVIVSKADRVIRMGGGHYQQLALNLFVKNHQNGDLNELIKEVCVRKNYVHVLSQQGTD